MDSGEWLQRMQACQSDLAKRLMLVLVALDPKTERMSGEARQAALATALQCSEAELVQAIAELERVGLASMGWLQ